MVIINHPKRKNGKSYTYDDKVMDTIFIDKKIKEDFRQLCKDKNLNKSKLIEEFYKSILLRLREGSLNSTNGYITINIFREPIKRKEETKIIVL
jgi:hypothetical protein